MTHSFRTLLLLVLICCITAGAQQKKKITPDIAYKTPVMQLTKPLPAISGWQDGQSYIESRKKEGEEKPTQVMVDAKSGKDLGEKKPDVSWNEYRSLADSSIDISKPLQSTKDNTRHIYVKDNDLYVLDVVKKEFKRLTNNPPEEKNPTFSPDGNMIAYTREGNLFAIDLATGREKQFTNDGGELVYNGWAAWVYYEEIFGRPSRYKAYWWSPNSKQIAFYRFDETNVPMFPIYNSKGQHGKLEKTHYPEVGDPNPMVRLGVTDVSNGKIAWADFNEKDDQYFGTPFWTPDGNALWTQWMNRGHG